MPNPNPNPNPYQVTDFLGNSMGKQEVQLNGLTGLKPAVSTDAGLQVQETYYNTLIPSPHPHSHRLPHPHPHPNPNPIAGPGYLLQHLAHRQRRRRAANLHRGGRRRACLGMDNTHDQRPGT